MNTDDLTKLALAGLLGGSLALTGCGDHGHDHDHGSHAHSHDGAGSGAGSAMAPGSGGPAKPALSETHDCRGKNVCKGLGGCKVTKEQLEQMAKVMGVPMAEAGEPHDCAGKNACKGLGGCSVDAEKFKKLKAALAEKEKK